MSAELVRTTVTGLDARHATTLPDGVEFAALYREHFDRLRRFVLGMTGQEALAEDVAQEALTRAYEHRGHVDLGRPLWPWLKCVAKRLIVDHARTAGREQPDPDPFVERSADEIDATAGLQLLRDTLRELPARQRVALTLRYLDDWTSTEVAATLGLSRAAVEQLLLRSRRSFSARYQELGGEPSTRLQVALWPLLALLARWRDRLTRLRRVGESGGAPLTLAADGVTNAVVAMTVSSVLLGGGVAMAATAPAREAVTAPVSAFEDESVRYARALPFAEREAAAAPPSPSAAVAKPVARTPTRPPSGTKKVAVVAAPPVKQAPTTTAEASRERDTGRLKVASEDSARVAELAPYGDADISWECGEGAVFSAGCSAYDAAESRLSP